MVDDRPENLLALRAILEPLGARLIDAHSGTEALKHLLSTEFALILMDVQMPGLDGFETASLIKDREKTRHIPIIFVTAISKDAKYIFQGYSAGAVDYISKPFDADILRSKVAVFIELWEKGEQVKRQAELLRRNEQLEQERQLAELERDLERRHLAQLADSEARLSRFKSTLDATLDSVFMFEPEKLQYTYANQGALRHLGYSYDEMMELTAVDVKPDLSDKQFRRLLQPLRSGQKPTLVFETSHRRKDGSLVPVEIFLQYIEREGEDGQFLSIVRDITERRRIADSLIAAKETAEREHANAERANRAKSEFIAGVSHELRTPLNAIIGFSKLLLNPRVGPLNDDQRAYTQDVVHSAEHLLQLINDILDLSKIEAGKMVLEPGSFSVADLLDQSLTVVRETAQNSGLELVVELSPEVEALPQVLGDTRKIKQVMYNLLSNAVKFTTAGSVTIRARCEWPAGGQVADALPELVISVQDTGIGIPDEHQARIFHAFEQVDSSYTRQQQGTGLGLALTRRIVELHGGRIWVDSIVGQGSTFSFTLPLRLADGGSLESPIAPAETSAAKPESSPKSESGPKQAPRAQKTGSKATTKTAAPSKALPAKGNSSKVAPAKANASKKVKETA